MYQSQNSSWTYSLLFPGWVSAHTSSSFSLFTCQILERTLTQLIRRQWRVDRNEQARLNVLSQTVRGERGGQQKVQTTRGVLLHFTGSSVIILPSFLPSLLFYSSPTVLMMFPTTISLPFSVMCVRHSTREFGFERCCKRKGMRSESESFRLLFSLF